MYGIYDDQCWKASSECLNCKFIVCARRFETVAVLTSNRVANARYILYSFPFSLHFLRRVFSLFSALTSIILYVILDLDMQHTYNLETLATTSKRWQKFRQTKRKAPTLVLQLTRDETTPTSSFFNKRGSSQKKSEKMMLRLQLGVTHSWMTEHWSFFFQR